MMRVDVLVIGAGPAGSATAAALSRAGASVVLVESSAHPRPKACAEYASPRILEELAGVGLERSAWAYAAVPLGGMQLHVGGRAAMVRYADSHGERVAWGLDRRQFDRLLAHHAADAGADLLENTTAVALDLDDNGHVSGARLRSRDGREAHLAADWVVGADGVRSNVARLAGVERSVRFPRRLGLVAHYAGADAERDHGEMHVGSGGYVGLAPMPNGELNVAMALPMRRAASGTRARFDAAIASIPTVADRLRRARRITPIRGMAPIAQRVSSVGGPGWLLVGDAAGFVDPFTGEGIYRALRSARAASTAILAGGDVVAAYRAERRRAFTAKSALTWLIQGFLLAPPLLRHAVARLDDRPRAALKLGSALGDLTPATQTLTPRALFEVLRP